MVAVWEPRVEAGKAVMGGHCATNLTQTGTDHKLYDMRASLNISLPEDMKDWIDAQVARAGYGTTSEYFRQLVREDQRRQVKDEIDAKLLAALESGDPIEMTPEWWEERRKLLARRVQARKSKS